MSKILSLDSSETSFEKVASCFLIILHFLAMAEFKRALFCSFGLTKTLV